MSKRWFLFLLLTIILPCGVLRAQVPETFTNLKVLPADIQKPELVAIMREWSFALGVRCQHCHAEKNPDSKDGSEFALDQKPAKATARLMFQMLQEINGKHLSQLPQPDRLSVHCSTCHRGVERPQPIGDILWNDIQLEGVAAAGEHYEKLREKYLEQGSYDFSSTPLDELAVRLSEEGQDLEAALALQEKNISWHPEESYSQMLLGSLLEKGGRLEDALAAYQQAKVLRPDSVWYQRQIERVEQTIAEAKKLAGPEAPEED